MATEIARDAAARDEFVVRIWATSDSEAAAFPRGSLDDWAIADARSWDAMAFEFRRAAAAVAAVHTREASAPIFPLLMLCRHHLELALQSVIDPPPFGHNLRSLWTQAEPLMKRAFGGHWDSEEAGRLRQAIDVFEVVDPDGQRTRYPTGVGGTPFERPATLFAFSLPGFMAEFERLADFVALSLIWMEIRRRREARNDHA